MTRNEDLKKKQDGHK